MKNKKQKQVNGLLNRPLLEHITVFGVAALVAGAVWYVGVLTDKGSPPVATRPPTLTTATRDADAAEHKTSLTLNLSGSDFSPGATVKLGERVSTQVTYVSSTTLRAVTMEQPSAIDTVTVINPDGQSASLPVTLAATRTMAAEQKTSAVNAIELSKVMSHISNAQAVAHASATPDLATVLKSWTW